MQVRGKIGEMGLVAASLVLQLRVERVYAGVRGGILAHTEIDKKYEEAMTGLALFSLQD